MVFLNVSAFWVLILSQGTITDLHTIITSTSIKDGLIALLFPILTLVLDGLLSADTKARFTYWRYFYPLPGCRAFSQHLSQEPRADPDRLLHFWGPFPEDPDQQNRLWYRMYKGVEQDIRVQEAHRAWLFSRDLTALSLVFLGIFGVATLFVDYSWGAKQWYLLALLAQYTVMMLSARTYGIRFVRTVLTLTSHADVPSPKN